MATIPGLAPEIRQYVAAAFAELMVNAMEHGGRFDSTRYVEMSYLRTPHKVVCHIKDPGEDFNIDELRHAAIANPQDNPMRHVQIRSQLGLRKGGYDIQNTSRMVDEVIYNENANEVLFVKYLPESEASKG